MYIFEFRPLLRSRNPTGSIWLYKPESWHILILILPSTKHPKPRSIVRPTTGKNPKSGPCFSTDNQSPSVAQQTTHNPTLCVRTDFNSTKQIRKSNTNLRNPWKKKVGWPIAWLDDSFHHLHGAKMSVWKHWKHYAINALGLSRAYGSYNQTFETNRAEIVPRYIIQVRSREYLARGTTI